MTINHRSTKVLLLLIAVALWGILLRPLFTSTPAQAQATDQAQGTGRVYFNYIVLPYAERGSFSMARLNTLGATGWRAKAITTTNNIDQKTGSENEGSPGASSGVSDLGRSFFYSKASWSKISNCCSCSLR